MIKKFSIELVLLALLTLFVSFFYNIDLKIHNFFNNADKPFDNNYFKNFFVEITDLGSSFWVFVLSFFCFVFSYPFSKKLFVYKKIKAFSVFLFLSIVLSGALTQLMKHILARPRPNYAIEDNFFGFSYFNLESSFHSFPSGHTSTIFAVALVLAVFTPNIKFFYFFFAGLVSFSRVVVGAHFFTDVVGGVVVAFIGVKIAKMILFKLGFDITLIKQINNNFFILTLIVLILLVGIVSIGGSIDIYISGLFYLGEQQFLLQSYDVFTIIVRKFFLYLLIIYLFILPAFSLFMPISKIYLNFKFNLKEVIFIFFTILLNLVVVVNMMLKNLWGRARPNDTIEFGGLDIHTHWFKISNACETNCSFVSGDASVGFSIILLYFITKKQAFLWLALFSGFLLGITRILEGGHFFSDVLLAGLLIFILSFYQSSFFQKKINTNVS